MGCYRNMLLGVGLALYTLATYLGWRYAGTLEQRTAVQRELWLLTAGIWLELAFMDLIPSTQTTFLGMLGFYRATLLSLVLFFTPIFVLALGQTLAQRLGRTYSSLNTLLFCGQNTVEGILIYSLYRVNPWLGLGYLVLTAPHAAVEAMALYGASSSKRRAIWALIGTHLGGVALGSLLLEGSHSLVGLAVFKQLMAGYLVYACLAEILPTAWLHQHQLKIPYSLFLGMLGMGLLNLV